MESKIKDEVDTSDTGHQLMDLYNKNKSSDHLRAPCSVFSSRDKTPKEKWIEAEQKRLAARLLEPAQIKKIERLRPDKVFEQKKIEELIGHPHEDPTCFTMAMAGSPFIGTVEMSNGLNLSVNMGLTCHIHWSGGALQALSYSLGEAEPVYQFKSNQVSVEITNLKTKEQCHVLHPEYQLMVRPIYADGKTREGYLVSWADTFKMGAYPWENGYQENFEIRNVTPPDGAFQYLKTRGELGHVIWPQHMRQVFAAIQKEYDVSQQSGQNGLPIFTRFDPSGKTRGKMHATAYADGISRFAGGWFEIPNVVYVRGGMRKALGNINPFPALPKPNPLTLIRQPVRQISAIGKERQRDT
ncbi:MAG: hypothetical protein IJV07_02200 [Alphaproteobacteria bacterium]|nr:hypothetical protein [Alphaproteobacteria bacterium]